MKRSLLIAAVLATNVGIASAGTVFDFMPRMDFYDQAEVVSKDTSKTGYVCDPSKVKSCTVEAKSVPSILPKTAKK